jgi:hypothetical protein
MPIEDGQTASLRFQDSHDRALEQERRDALGALSPREIFVRARPKLALADALAERAAAAFRTGWRPLLGFIGCYVALFAFVLAPAWNIAVDYTATNFFLGMVFTQALARGVEKHLAQRLAPAG